MQTSGHRPSALNDEVSSTFAERAKAARLRAGLTQQQLSDRLRNEAEVLLDTSAITRIEAGQREPRLSEALAIARVLEFGLNNLVPRADLDFYMSDVERLMDESRAALVKMIRSVDPVVDFVRRNPDCLGDDRLEDRFREVVEWFHQRVSHEDFGHEDEQTELRHHEKPDRRETETPTAAGGQRRNSRQSRRDPTRIRQMVQRRRRRRPPGTPRGFDDGRDASRMATRRVPRPCRAVGETFQ